jgi:hypothetical protein
VRRSFTTAVAITALSATLGACGSGGSGPPAGPAPARTAAAAQTPNPSDFVRHVDNPWYPLIPGTVYRWRGVARGKPVTDVLSVTNDTKQILGVTTTVIHDRFYRNGRLVEATTDWYAQDREGTVWYFGEATRELDRKGRVVSRAGSWQAGVDGAQAGIFMPARPRVGQAFRQETYEGHAEDRFRIRSLHASVKTPYVTSRRAMRTTETTPLEPGVVDAKYYVRGIGTVVEATVKGPEHERLELVAVSHRR